MKNVIMNECDYWIFRYCSPISCFYPADFFSNQRTDSKNIPHPCFNHWLSDWNIQLRAMLRRIRQNEHFKLTHGSFQHFCDGMVNKYFKVSLNKSELILFLYTAIFFTVVLNMHRTNLKCVRKSDKHKLVFIIHVYGIIWSYLIAPTILLFRMTDRFWTHLHEFWETQWQWTNSPFLYSIIILSIIYRPI